MAGEREPPYLFRTYENLERGATELGRRQSRNPGPAHDIPIWQVARATSAAPTYFKEIKIDGRSYLDGGFGGVNNPCEEMYNEVLRMNNGNAQSVRAIVSIGTGKSNSARMLHTGPLSKFWGYINFAKKWATDSENVHERMENRQAEAEDPFYYERFNVEGGLDGMKLDEWRARGPTRLMIGRAIAKVRRKRVDGKAAPQHSDNDVHRDEGEKEDDAAGTSHVDHPEAKLKIPKWCRPRNKTLDAIRKRTEDYLSQEQVRTLTLSPPSLSPIPHPTSHTTP